MSVSFETKDIFSSAKEASFPLLRTCPIGLSIKRLTSDTSSDNWWRQVTTNYNSSVYWGYPERIFFLCFSGKKILIFRD